MTEGYAGTFEGRTDSALGRTTHLLGVIVDLSVACRVAPLCVVSLSYTAPVCPAQSCLPSSLGKAYLRPLIGLCLPLPFSY